MTGNIVVEGVIINTILNLMGGQNLPIINRRIAMNGELFEDVAGQLIGLLNLEIDKRDFEYRNLREKFRALEDSSYRVQQELDSAREENRSLRNIPTEKVNVKQIKLDVLLELATAHPEWAVKILLLQFPDADIVNLLGRIIEFCASKQKIEAIKLLRGLTPHPSNDDLSGGAYIYLKQAKEFVEAYVALEPAIVRPEWAAPFGIYI